MTIIGSDLDNVIIHVRTRSVDEGTVFDYEIHGGAAEVVVAKGGPNANVYDYLNAPDPTPGPQVADDGLHSPENPNNDRFFGLSHISFCITPIGFLKVQKFIDVDADGVLDDGLDITSGEVNLAGWQFNVYAGDSTDAGDLVATLETDSTGMTSELQLAAGTYTVQEANTGKTILTAVEGGSTTELTTPDGNKLTQEVVVGDTTTYTFGNACLITKVFQITADTGLSGVTAFYDTDPTDNAISADAVFVPLSDGDGDGVYTAIAPDLFQIGDQIEWGFGLDTNGDGSLADEAAAFIDEQVTDETFTMADGYPSCLKTNIGELDNPEIVVTKFKDANDDGDRDLGEPELDGWTMTVFGSEGAEVASGVTGADGAGTVVFEDLAIGGTYTVCETLQDNWLQTFPTDADSIINPDDCHEVGPLGIDDSAEVAFLNSPLSEIRVGFTDLTGSTDVTITCTDSEGNVVFTESTSGEIGEDDDFTVFDDYRLRQGTLSCDFEVVDP